MSCVLDNITSVIPDGSNKTAIVNAILTLSKNEVDIISIGDKNLIRLENGNLVNIDNIVSFSNQNFSNDLSEKDVYDFIKKEHSKLLSPILSKEDKKSVNDFIEKNGSYTSFNHFIEVFRNKFYNESNFWIKYRDENVLENHINSLDNVIKHFSDYLEDYENYIDGINKGLSEYTELRQYLTSGNTYDIGKLDYDKKKKVRLIQTGLLYKSHLEAIANNTSSPLVSFFKYFTENIERPDTYDKESEISNKIVIENNNTNIEEETENKEVDVFEERSNVLSEQFIEDGLRTPSKEVQNHLSFIPTISIPKINSIKINDKVEGYQISVESLDNRSGNRNNYYYKQVQNVLLNVYNKALSYYSENFFYTFRDALLFSLLYDGNVENRLNDKVLQSKLKEFNSVENRIMLSYAIRFFSSLTESDNLTKIRIKIKGQETLNLSFALKSEDYHLQALYANNQQIKKLGYENTPSYRNFYNVLGGINSHMLSTIKAKYFRLNLEQTSSMLSMENNTAEDRKNIGEKGIEKSTDTARIESQRIILDFFKLDKNDSSKEHESLKGIISFDEFANKMNLSEEEKKSLDLYLSSKTKDELNHKDAQIGKKIVERFSNIMMKELGVDVEELSDIVNAQNMQERDYREFLYPYSALLFSRTQLQEKGFDKVIFTDNIPDNAIFYSLLKNMYRPQNTYNINEKTKINEQGVSNMFILHYEDDGTIKFTGTTSSYIKNIEYKDKKNGDIVTRSIMRNTEQTEYTYAPNVVLENAIKKGYIIQDGIKVYDKPLSKILYPKREYNIQTIKAARGNVPIIQTQSFIENISIRLNEVFPLFHSNQLYRILEVQTNSLSEGKSYKELTPKDRVIYILKSLIINSSPTFTPANKSINYNIAINKMNYDEFKTFIKHLSKKYFIQSYYIYTGDSNIDDNLESSFTEAQERIDEIIDTLNREISVLDNYYEKKKYLYKKGLLENIDYVFNRDKKTISFPNSLRFYTQQEAEALENDLMDLLSKENKTDSDNERIKEIFDLQKVNHFLKTNNWAKRYEEDFVVKFNEILDKYLSKEEKKSLSYYVNQIRDYALSDYYHSQNELAYTFHSPLDNNTKAMKSSVELSKRIIARQLNHTIGDLDFSLPFLSIAVREDITYSQAKGFNNSEKNQFLELQDIINPNHNKADTIVRDATVLVTTFFSKLLKRTHRISAEGISKMGQSGITNRGTNSFIKGATLRISRALKEGDFTNQLETIEKDMLGKTLTKMLDDIRNKKKKQIDNLVENNKKLEDKYNKNKNKNITFIKYKERYKDLLYQQYLVKENDYDDLVDWYISTKNLINNIISSGSDLGKRLDSYFKSYYADNVVNKYSKDKEGLLAYLSDLKEKKKNISAINNIINFVNAIDEFTGFYANKSSAKTYIPFVNNGRDMVKYFVSPLSYGEVTNIVAQDGYITNIPAPTQANYILSNQEILDTLSQLQDKGYEQYREDFDISYLKNITDKNGVVRKQTEKERLEEIEENIRTALVVKFEASGDIHKVNSILSGFQDIYLPNMLPDILQEMTKKIKRKVATPEVRGQRYAVADATGMFHLLEFNGELYTVSDALSRGFISRKRSYNYKNKLKNTSFYVKNDLFSKVAIRDLSPGKLLKDGLELRGDKLVEAVNNIKRLNYLLSLSKKQQEEYLLEIENLSKEVKSYEVTPFEVVLPFEARKLFGIKANMSLQEAKEFIIKKNPNKLKSFEEYINNAVATRIPTSSLASLQPIKIVAFVNGMNNIALLPHELLDISGADTDGDTISIEYVSVDKDGLDENDFSTKSVKAKRNALLNPLNFVSLMTPIDNSLLESKAKEEIANVKDEFQEKHGFFNIFSKINSQIQNLAALKLVGIFVKFNQIYSYYGFLIKNEIISDDLPEIVFNGVKYNKFNFYNSNGENIQETINQLVNAALDDTKFNYSGVLNINNATSNFINILLMYGIPFNQILDFINKPHIKELSLMLNNFNSFDILPGEKYKSKNNYELNAIKSVLDLYIEKNKENKEAIKEIEKDLEFFRLIRKKEDSLSNARAIVNLNSFKTNIDSYADTIQSIMSFITKGTNILPSLSSFYDLDIDNIVKNLEKNTDKNSQSFLLQEAAILNHIPLFKNILSYLQYDLKNKSNIFSLASKSSLDLFTNTFINKDGFNSYTYNSNLYSNYLRFLSQKFAIDFLRDKGLRLNTYKDVTDAINAFVKIIEYAKETDLSVKKFMNKYVLVGDTNIDDFKAYYNKIPSNSLSDIERFQIKELFNSINDNNFKDAFVNYVMLTNGISGYSYRNLSNLLTDKSFESISSFAKRYDPKLNEIIEDEASLKNFLNSYSMFNPERAGKLYGNKKMNTDFSRTFEGIEFNNGESKYIVPYSIRHSIQNKYLFDNYALVYFNDKFKDSYSKNANYQLESDAITSIGNNIASNFLKNEAIDFIANQVKKIGIDVVILNDSGLGYKGKIEGSKLYLNIANMTLDTPFHELAHIDVLLLKLLDRETYDKLANDIIYTETYKQVKEVYSKLNLSREELIEEAMAQILGIYAGKRFSEIKSQSAHKNIVERLFSVLSTAFERLLNYIRPLVFGSKNSYKDLRSFATDYAKKVMNGTIQRNIEDVISIRSNAVYQLTNPTTVKQSAVMMGGTANFASNSYISNLYREIQAMATELDPNPEFIYNGVNYFLSDFPTQDKFADMVRNSKKETMKSFSIFNSLTNEKYDSSIEELSNTLKSVESSDIEKQKARYNLAILSTFEDFNADTDRIETIVEGKSNSNHPVIKEIIDSNLFTDSDVIIKIREVNNQYYVDIVNTSQEGLKKVGSKKGYFIKNLIKSNGNGLFGNISNWLSKFAIGVNLDDSLETTLSIETVAMAMYLKSKFKDNIFFEGMGIIPLNNIKKYNYKEIAPNEYIEAMKELLKYSRFNNETLLPEPILKILEDEKISDASNYSYNYLLKLFSYYKKKGIEIDDRYLLENIDKYFSSKELYRDTLLKSIRYRIKSIKSKINVEKIDFSKLNNSLEKEYYYLIRLYHNISNQGRDAYNSLKDIDSIEKYIRTDIENKNPYFQWVYDSWYKAKFLVSNEYKAFVNRNRTYFTKYIDFAKKKYGTSLIRYEGNYYQDLFKYEEIEEDGKKVKINTFRLLNENDAEWKRLSKQEKEFINSFNNILFDMLVESIMVQRGISLQDAKSLALKVYPNVKGLVPVMRSTTEKALFSGDITGALETSFDKMIERADYYDAENSKDYESISNYFYNQLFSFAPDANGVNYGTYARKRLIGYNEDGTWDIKQNQKVSLDLMDTINYFQQNLLKKKFMDEISDVWHIARSMLQVREANTGITQKNNIELLNSMVKRKLYGERLTFSESKFANQVEKILLTANNVTSYLALGFNYASNLKAFLSNTMSIVVKTFGNQKDIFGEKELAIAMKEVATSPKKALFIAEEFGFINYLEMEKVLNKRISGTDQSIMGNLKISKDIPFIGDALGDYYNKLTVMVAQMIKDGTWDSLSLDEEDGNIYLKYDTSKDKRHKELIKYLYNQQIEQGLIKIGEKMKIPYDIKGIMKLETILNRVSGTLTEGSETLVQTTVIGKSLTKFKIFSIPYINKIFKQKGKNFNYKKVEYKNGEIVEIYPHEEAMFFTLMKSIAYIKHYGLNKGIDAISENFSEDAKENLINSAINMVTLGICLVLRMIMDDDEENKRRKRKYGKDDFTYRLFNDALNDISMFNVFSTGTSLNVASISILKRFADALTDLMMLDLDNGTRKMIKSVGFLNSVDALYRMYDKEGYSSYRNLLKAYTRKKENTIKDYLGIDKDYQ